MAHEHISRKEFRKLVMLYWRSGDASVKKSLLFLFLSMGLVVLSVGTNVYLNQLGGAFMSAIQQYQPEKITHFAIILVAVFVTFSLLGAYQGYVFSLMQIRWRNWLTQHCVAHWLGQRNFYQLETFGSDIDNPDQRIAQDVATLVNIFSALILAVLNSVLTLVSFAVILWNLSTPFKIPLGGHHLTIYGDMLWIALIYSVFSTYATFVVGRPIINLSFWQQRYEAFFRYNLVRIRENCEAIAMYHGEDREHAGLKQKFSDVITNFIALAKKQRRLDIVTGVINYSNNLMPTLVALPGYFAKRYDMGGISRISQAFGVVSNALGVFITNYVQIAQIIATSQRLQSLLALEGAAKKVEGGPALAIKYQRGALSAEGLELYRPNGDLLHPVLNFAIRAGEHTLITGASGVGKSTLLRTIAGIWPFAKGTLVLPEGELLFVPQKPYLPEGSLRDVLIFPKLENYDEEKIKATLVDVHLAHLVPQLGENINWSQKLSLGEQQRLSFARALLQQPSWLLLDEATSAMDEGLEIALYQLLFERLPNTTVISVAHRSTLREMHAYVLSL
jgi:vitamin B12/bleomycin/antimicrobial peptide transport system ATP-binding/permease protein